MYLSMYLYIYVYNVSMYIMYIMYIYLSIYLSIYVYPGVTGLLNWAVRNAAETEALMNSVERYVICVWVLMPFSY
jgi:hypothetical protein